MSGPARRVVIVGRDAAGWIAALALKRALGPGGVQVELVELPSLLTPVDAFVAVPALAGLHKLLGIEESELLPACSGIPIVAQRFANWGKSRPPFLHGYDVVDQPSGDLAFVHYWVKARAAGLRVPIDDFSPAAAAAKQARVTTGAIPSGDFVPSHGYHLDARAYCALVRRHALRAGVAVRAAAGVAPEPSDCGLAAVLLDDGIRLEADLFIDASGSEALLIRETSAAAFEDWSSWLPADTILAASAPKLANLPSFSEISAFKAGWVGLYPLQTRTAVTVVWDSASFSNHDLLEALPALTGLAIQGDAFVTPFRAGIRRHPWTGNCIAIGDAAVNVEPLDAVQLHLIHIGVSHLISLFPVDTVVFPEAKIYNDAVVAHAENIRDFQIAHYRLNERYDEPFWDKVREAPCPGGLEAKLDLFGSRGELILYDHESFEGQNWSSIFIGHGLIPRQYDPRIDRLTQEEHMTKIQHRLSNIAAQVNAMTPVETYLRQDTAELRRDR